MIQKEDPSFTFPFDTCETPHYSGGSGGPAQPYSFFVNIASISVVFYFLCLTRKISNFFLMLSLFAFEAVHTFSHFIHLPNASQVNLIHPLSYFINIFYLLVLYQHTHHFPSAAFLLFLGALFTLDVYFFIFLPFVYSFTTFFAIFFSILLYYYRFLSRTHKSQLTTIGILGVAIVLLFYNEKINCKRMLAVFPDFSFHSIFELVGLAVFFMASRFFYDL